MLSGSTNISIDGGMGVHMAAIALPNGSQGFVGITSPAMYGMAYLDPDHSNQVIYNAGSSTNSDSFTFSYVDGMGMTDDYTVNVTITGSGTGMGTGSGSGSGSGADSSSGNSYSNSSGGGSGGGSGSSSGSNTPPMVASLVFNSPMAHDGRVSGSFVGTFDDATPTRNSAYTVEVDTNGDGNPDGFGLGYIYDGNFVSGDYFASGEVVLGATTVYIRVTEPGESSPGIWQAFPMYDGVSNDILPPIAEITAPSSITYGSGLTFDGSESRDPDFVGGGVETWEWDFGADGSIDATYTYFTGALTIPWETIAAHGGTAGGQFQLKLTVIDDELQTTTSSTKTVNIGMSQNPNAIIMDSSGEDGSLSLDGATSNDPDLYNGGSNVIANGITSYSWTSNGAGAVPSSDPTLSMTASQLQALVGNAGGTVTFTLTVTDNENETGAITRDVTVPAVTDAIEDNPIIAVNQTDPINLIANDTYTGTPTVSLVRPASAGILTKTAEGVYDFRINAISEMEVLNLKMSILEHITNWYADTNTKIGDNAENSVEAVTRLFQKYSGALSVLAPAVTAGGNAGRSTSVTSYLGLSAGATTGAGVVGFIVAQLGSLMAQYGALSDDELRNKLVDAIYAERDAARADATRLYSQAIGILNGVQMIGVDIPDVTFRYKLSARSTSDEAEVSIRVFGLDWSQAMQRMMVAENIIRGSLPPGPSVVPVKEVLGELWLEIAESWRGTWRGGNLQQLSSYWQSQLGYIWTSNSTDWIGFWDASDVAAELNALGYRR